MLDVFFSYHKLLVPVGFMEDSLDCLCPLFGICLDFFYIVTPRMFTFSLEYVENERGYCCYGLKCI